MDISGDFFRAVLFNQVNYTHQTEKNRFLPLFSADYGLNIRACMYRLLITILGTGPHLRKIPRKNHIVTNLIFCFLQTLNILSTCIQ